MGEFNITSGQAEFLVKLAAHSLETGNQNYYLAISSGPVAGRLIGTEQECAELDHLPILQPFYEALDRKGYLQVAIVPREGLTDQIQMTLTKKLFDFARYSKRSRLGRGWHNLKYDLGKDDSCRSKVIWLIAAVLIANMIAYGMSRLGVL